MRSSSEEKVLPPSAKKLRDARRKGQVASSREFVNAAGSAAALGYVALRGPWLVDAARSVADAAASLSALPWQQALPALLSRIAWMAAGFVLPLLGLILLCVLAASVIGNGGVVFSLDPLLPKMERIDPIAGFGRIFSMRNAVNGLKTVFKFVVVGVTVLLLLRSAARPLAELPACGLGCVPGLTGALFGPLLLTAIVLFLVLGVMDLRLQRFLFRREMRMTLTERKRERQEAEGNPLIKGARRRERQATLRNHVRTGLRNATFVIRAEDIALALRYAPPDVLVPVLVARARGEAAAALLEEASLASLPTVLNPEVATLLSTRMQVGGLLSKELFPPVIACMREAGVL